TVVGTFGYMPPEQYEGRASAASDVYALGMLLCALVTGREPWQLDEDPRDELRRACLPTDLKAAILACLERDPDRRPVDGAAAAARLRGGVAGAEVRRRAPLARMAVGCAVPMLLAVVGGGAAFWFLTGDAGPVPRSVARQVFTPGG